MSSSSFHRKTTVLNQNFATLREENSLFQLYFKQAFDLSGKYAGEILIELLNQYILTKSFGLSTKYTTLAQQIKSQIDLTYSPDDLTRVFAILNKLEKNAFNNHLIQLFRAFFSVLPHLYSQLTNDALKKHLPICDINNIYYHTVLERVVSDWIEDEKGTIKKEIIEMAYLTHQFEPLLIRLMTRLTVIMNNPARGRIWGEDIGLDILNQLTLLVRYATPSQVETMILPAVLPILDFDNSHLRWDYRHQLYRIMEPVIKALSFSVIQKEFAARLLKIKSTFDSSFNLLFTLCDIKPLDDEESEYKQPPKKSPVEIENFLSSVRQIKKFDVFFQNDHSITAQEFENFFSNINWEELFVENAKLILNVLESMIQLPVEIYPEPMRTKIFNFLYQHLDDSSTKNDIFLVFAAYLEQHDFSQYKDREKLLNPFKKIFPQIKDAKAYGDCTYAEEKILETCTLLMNEQELINYVYPLINGEKIMKNNDPYLNLMNHALVQFFTKVNDKQILGEFFHFVVQANLIIEPRGDCCFLELIIPKVTPDVLAKSLAEILKYDIEPDKLARHSMVLALFYKQSCQSYTIPEKLSKYPAVQSIELTSKLLDRKTSKTSCSLM